MSKKSKPKKESKMGRPTKWTPELQEAIRADIAAGLSQEDAATLNGIAETTFYDWMRTNPKFSQDIKEAVLKFEKEQLLVIREASVNRYNRNGDLTRRGSWVAAAWILERKHHEKYGQRWAGELTGKGGKPLIPEKPSVDLSDLTDEELINLGTAAKIHIDALTKVKPAESNGTNGSNGSGNGDSH